MKDSILNKVKLAPANKAPVKADSNHTVQIEVLPLHGIGGIGGPGSRAYVTPDEAKEWVDGGYARIVKKGEKPEAIPSQQPELPTGEEGEK